jgi:hypothetical protein
MATPNTPSNENTQPNETIGATSAKPRGKPFKKLDPPKPANKYEYVPNWIGNNLALLACLVLLVLVVDLKQRTMTRLHEVEASLSQLITTMDDNNKSSHITEMVEIRSARDQILKARSDTPPPAPAPQQNNGAIEDKIKVLSVQVEDLRKRQIRTTKRLRQGD